MEIEHHERREYNLQMASDIGAIKQMIEGLAGEHGRVTALEEAQKTAETRSWVQTAIVIPVVAALHLGAKKIGW
jgi:GTP-sensing pleiotropic transcriptional regulator CodY